MKRRRPSLTAEQQRRRRDFLWLFGKEFGLYDPVAGRVRPHSTYEIANLFGVSIRSVQVGIARARSLRRLIEDLHEHAS